VHRGYTHQDPGSLFQKRSPGRIHGRDATPLIHTGQYQNRHARFPLSQFSHGAKVAGGQRKKGYRGMGFPLIKTKLRLRSLPLVGHWGETGQFESASGTGDCLKPSLQGSRVLGMQGCQGCTQFVGPSALNHGCKVIWKQGLQRDGRFWGDRRELQQTRPRKLQQ